MIREILKMGDERLLRVAQPVPDEMFDTPELWQLLDDMLQTMEHAGGVGLAAPQIGVDLQLVVFGFEHSERYPDAEAVPQTILINPLITPLSPAVEEDWRVACRCRVYVGSSSASTRSATKVSPPRVSQSYGLQRGFMRGSCSMSAIT